MSDQLTLVAFYGDKPPELDDFVGEIQDLVTAHLGDRFTPYPREQVHATIVGLEGVRRGDEIVNANFMEMRREARVIDFTRLLSILRASLPIEVQLGGYRQERPFPFESQGLHPYLRSFSIRGRIAVAIGWPTSAGSYPQRLDSLRWALNDAGVLHKYHRDPGDVDNDLFLVLGRVADPGESERALTHSVVREHLAQRAPLSLTVSEEHVSLVAYEDPQLPFGSCERIGITAAAADVRSLVHRYGEAG